MMVATRNQNKRATREIQPRAAFVLSLIRARARHASPLRLVLNHRQLLVLLVQSVRGGLGEGRHRQLSRAGVRP
jgi:hypothetical protein